MFLLLVNIFQKIIVIYVMLVFVVDNASFILAVSNKKNPVSNCFGVYLFF